MRRVQITCAAQVDEATLLARIARLSARTPAECGAAVVLLRDPELCSTDLLALAWRLRERTRAVGARLWVNDRLDVAALVEADGVHLGRRSVGLEEARRFLGDHVSVSIACHHPDEVVAARDRGADAATLSPIFASPGKRAPLGLDAVGEARARLGGAPRFSLIALGGIDSSSAEACFSAGADAVAAIRSDVLELRTRPSDDPRSPGTPP